MRNTRMMALAVASLVSSATLVQAQGGVARAYGMPRAGCAMGSGLEGRPGARGLFRGVKLSDAEKAKLRTIREKYLTQGQELRKSQRPAMEEIRALRQKGDTAGARAAFARTKGDRDKGRALMEQGRDEIRDALSTENQKVFDANLKQAEARRAEFTNDGHSEGRGGRACQHRMGSHGPRTNG